MDEAIELLIAGVIFSFFPIGYILLEYLLAIRRIRKRKRH